MELLLFRIWFPNLVVKTLDSNSKYLTSDVNKTRNEVLVPNISLLWNDLLGPFTYINMLKICRFLWFYNLVFRTLYFESKISSSNLLAPSINCCSLFFIDGFIIYWLGHWTIFPNYWLWISIKPKIKSTTPILWLT